MCIERFQNLEWKPIHQMIPVSMTLENESRRILAFIAEDQHTSESLVDELEELEILVQNPTFGIFREFQSKVFHCTLLPEFKEFWDANPTIHTTIDSSERATDGEVVMACNQFLSEYYDFGLSDDECLSLELLEPPPEKAINQPSWRCMILRMCSSQQNASTMMKATMT